MKSLGRRFYTALLILAMIFQTLPAFSVQTYADTANRTVRVGFFAYPGYHEIENGEKSGYGFDFLILLQRYTNLNYEFVGYDKSWEEMQQMLLDGQIDVVTSARKTPEREERFDFSEPIGISYAQISVRFDDERFVPGDYNALNGMVVGELAGNSRNADVDIFAADKGLNFTVREYSGAEELARALKDGKVDAIATSSLRKSDGEKLVAKFAPEDFFCIVRKGDTELINEINYGIGQMDVNEGNWRDDLYYKYYESGNSSILSFTPKELEYISAVQRGEKTVTAIAQPDAVPYSFVDNNKLTGIIPDYFAHLMEMAGLPYTVMVAKDRSEFRDWILGNAADVVMDFRYGTVMSEMEDFGLLTDPYMELTTSRVTRKGFAGKIRTIATVDSWGISSIDDDFADDARLVNYDSREAALKAVNSGEADVCYVYSYTAERFINTDPDSILQANILKNPVYDEYIYINPDYDHELCSILNKCIKADNSGFLDEYVKRYTTVTYENLNLFNYLRLHPWLIFIGAILALFICALIAVAIMRTHTAKMKSDQLKREQDQQMKLEESLTFTNFFLGTYVSAYFVNLDTQECQVYKRTEELEKEFPIVHGYLESLTEYIEKCVHPDDRSEMISITRPERMKRIIEENEEFFHVFRDISSGTERIYKMQVIRGLQPGQAAFGFLDISDEYREQQKRFLGAVQLAPDILPKANIGLWAFELDEGRPPRMYVDDTMLGLIGLDHQISPEETYHAWYDYIDKDSYELVNDAVGKMVAGEHAEVQYPWHHPDGHTIIVRCGGVQNPEYTGGIRIEGTHQNVTAVLHFDEEEQRREKEDLTFKLVSALSEAYSSLYYVNAETGEYQLITRDDEFGNKVNSRLSHGGDFFEDSARSTPEVIYPDDIDKMQPFKSRENMEKAFEGNDDFSVDYRLVIEGAPVWYRVRTVKIQNSDNELYYAVGIISIQNQIEQEEQLQKNRDIIEILASEYTSVYYIDLTTDDLTPYTMNETTESAFGMIFRSGISYSNAFRMYVDSLVYDEDKAKMLSAGAVYNIRKELADKKTFVTTYRSDNYGEPHYCEMKFVKVGDDANPRAVALGFADKNDEIRKELQRKEIAARDAAVIAGLSDDFGCVVYVDFNTGEEVHYRFDPLLLASIPGWDKITNFDKRIATLADELIYEDDKVFFSDPAEGKRIILDIVNREGVYYRNFRVVIGGELKYYQLKIVKDENSDNHVIAGLRSVDETAKKEMEYQDKLEAANKSKTDFLFNMSHDIRTPMNAIIGFTQLAKKHIDDRERTIDSLNKIESSGNHLLELINEVLDMSRVEAGKLHSDMKTVSVIEAAERLVTICQESASARNLSLTLEKKNIDHTLVIADELHINQVIMNILGNSIKYTQPGGSIRYTIEERESEAPGYGRYIFTVEDTGIGMSAEFLKHIFESFAREDKATTSEIQGTGLGMAIVKRLVEFMDGTIDIESEQGRGTKVTVTFQLKIADEEAERSEPVECTVMLEGRRVLLVEDNELNREIATDMLGEHGLIVEEAINGIDAVEHVKERGTDYYDFILMDIQMPMMDGYETTARIRKLPGADKLPIIALSANAFEEDKRKSIEAGMNAHVSKPIVISNLIETLSHFSL